MHVVVRSCDLMTIAAHTVLMSFTSSLVDVVLEGIELSENEVAGVSLDPSVAGYDTLIIKVTFTTKTDQRH
jgi:hypothetical protein